MFRLGGNVRQNYNTGTSLEDIRKLIGERSKLREKALGGIRTALPFSVLASQMDDIRTIRKPGDVFNILSNIGGSPELMGALAKLPTLDLKKSEEYGDELRATLNKHNLTHLANKKPGLIENRMQDKTDALWKDLESITGATPSE